MPRDEIAFSCVKSQIEDYMTTMIYINGIDLKSIIGAIESEQFAKKGLRLQNSSYEGICFFIAFHYQNHFLGKTLGDYIYDKERYTLFEYQYSGIPGDHSLTCKTSIKKEVVTWYDFKNYSKVIPFELDYGDLQFSFCINQYIDAINLVRYNEVV
ncbi:MAG: hypothetical protein AAF985_25960 [Bacteroidota bacterium]